MKKRRKKRPFEITKKMELAAKIFAGGGYFTLQEAADKVGVNRTTLWRWQQHREYRAYCEKVRRQIVGEAIRKWRKEERQKRQEIKRSIKRIEEETRAERFAKAYREMDYFLRANHCSEKERLDTLKAFEKYRDTW